MSVDNPEEYDALRAEIQAAIAAGRELDPTMDQHLADSALDRYRKEQSARQRPVRAPQVPAVPRGAVAAQISQTVLGVAVIAAIVIGLIVSHGTILEYWWVIFFLGPMFGFWGRGWRRSWHYQTAQQMSPPDDEDEATKRQLKIAERRLKIEQLQAEIKKLKDDSEA